MKFADSLYSGIWKSNTGREIMKVILTNPDLISIKPAFYASKFLVDPEICPSNARGEATFVSKMREMETGGLMDMRAPLSDTITVDRKPMSSYSDTIPEFSARGYVEQAMERMYKEDMFEQFGDDELIATYAQNEIQRMINSAQQTLSYQSAMLLSTGRIVYDQGLGIQGNLIKAAIPQENFDTAGKAVWSDPTAKIITQMIEKEDKYRQKWGIDIPLVWEIKKKEFIDKFLPNEQVKEWVLYTKEINGTPLPSTFGLSLDIVLEALAKYPGLSPITLIDEKSFDYENGYVEGWKPNVAVLRPRGYAGYIRRSTILDEKVFKKYGNSVNSYNFTRTLNGLATIMNSECVNGNFKEWHTDLFMKAIPTLDEFLYHVIIDTATADE
jgi:hypothetical protein